MNSGFWRAICTVSGRADAIAPSHLIMVRVMLRKKILCIRFRRRDLFQLDELAKSLGLPSRSRLANIALQTFLDSSAEKVPFLGQKRPVKLLLDSALKQRLDEMARKLQVPKTELVKIALKEFAEQRLSSGCSRKP